MRLDEGSDVPSAFQPFRYCNFCHISESRLTQPGSDAK